MPSNLSEESKIICAQFLERADVQARPGLRKGLENLLTGRKPTPRQKGEVNQDALPSKD
jgi:hypothetical protein